MLTRQEIKARARDVVRQHRSAAIGVTVMPIVAGFVSGILDFIAGALFGPVGYWIVYWIGMFVLIVISVNMLGEYIKLWNGQKPSPEALFKELKVNFWRKLGGSLWAGLFVFLWSLLLVIPGIIKAMSYYFTQNILADCPNVSATDAIKISMKITDGHKMDVFIFILSWIGWMLLSSLTLGILYIVWVGPYWGAADAGFYLELKNKALREGKITLADLGQGRNE